jgi:arabinan endo-1,5-alpha-L-arabinosidase
MNKITPVLNLILLLFVSCNNRIGINCEDAGPNIPDDYSKLTDITHYKSWGVYNVHDPSCIKAGKYYYLYSTDAIYFPKGAVTKSDTIHIGNIQVRRSSDLVHWDFIGWAFDSIPEKAMQHVKSASGGQIPHGIWAPYILKTGNEFRLYYAVSAFGANTSFIGMASSPTPEGPWQQVGCVVKTFKTDAMNAIDPTVVTDSANAKQWMIYGSFFGGIYCVELDPKTGLTINAGDKGKCIAKRAEGDTHIIEAPEVIYNPKLKKYYLFVSYDALFTNYNVRVGRADKPEGPYFDSNNKNIAEPENSFPILTYAYRFRNHQGWAGVGHCSVINDNGQFFMFHQGRLAPDNLMMVLHVRRILWNSNGWPVVSPERYAGVQQFPFSEKDIIGKWENIRLSEIIDTVKLWQGQIPRGGWHYDSLKFNNSTILEFLSDGKVLDQPDMTWKINNDRLRINLASTKDSVELMLLSEWDWENNRKTIVYTGISTSGNGIWGKKTN